MNSRDLISKKLLAYWSYSKDQFKKNTNKAYAFSQTNLGVTLVGGIAGSILTYSLGYSKSTQAKEQAEEALVNERNINAALVEQNFNNQTIISSLTQHNTQLLDDKIDLCKKDISIINKYEKCVSDLRLISILHENSFFKPSIKPIIDTYNNNFEDTSNLNLQK